MLFQYLLHVEFRPRPTLAVKSRSATAISVGIWIVPARGHRGICSKTYSKRKVSTIQLVRIASIVAGHATTAGENPVKSTLAKDQFAGVFGHPVLSVRFGTNSTVTPRVARAPCYAFRCAEGRTRSGFRAARAAHAAQRARRRGYRGVDNRWDANCSRPVLRRIPKAISRFALRTASGRSIA